MRRYNLITIGVVAATVAIAAPGGNAVWAGGYWNMPGTLSQRAGHGYSGGYHAPFILGPIKLDGWGAPNEIRLPCAPCCCCCNYACGCDGSMEVGTKIEGAVSVPPAVQQLPQGVPQETTQAAEQVSPPAAAESSAEPPIEAGQSEPPARPIFEPPIQP